MMNKIVTIKDVAKKANVGVGTVSRVLNHHPSVKEKTRLKVMEAIQALEYNPNAIARSLKAKETRSVGVMIPDISSAFFPEVVRGIEDVASAYKYHIILCNIDLDREKEKVSLQMLKEKKVDGIIFISNTVDEGLRSGFKKIEIPIVLVSTRDPANEFKSVIIDNAMAAYEAVDYLCKLGHREIAMIAGQKDDPNAGIPRVEGYKRALRENHIQVKEEWIYHGDYRYKSGYDIMQEILKKEKLPTAVFAASDTMAVGAASAVLHRGYHIPGHISIVGFDGIEVSEYFYPSITTIRQPRYDMGACGMRLLMKMLKGENVEENEVILKHELIKRNSCRAVRGD
ncbi:Catabolite control protein A [Thermotalea metallivorans]|uniref:Catabolite control protein A n=2 Tax=Thermotalea metallivorans TaxID=520762 RepID=A0A140L4G7_9FIRM|nr:Catabolite control protein A [Thermotalea metallivorans]